jgi:hypothetical protein
MPRVQNPSIGAGATVVLTTTTQLTAAQINALSVTPVQLVPAPGAGKIIVVTGAAFVFTAGTIIYQTSGSDLINLAYAANPAQFVTTQPGSLITKFPLGSGFSYVPGALTGMVAPVPGDVNQAIQLVAQSPYDEGAIATSSLAAGGAGYVANDTGTFTDGNGDATYRVLTVGAGGAVLTYSITNPGTGYPIEINSPTATGGAQPGVGVGFEINILTLNLGNGTLKVVTYYQIIPVP